MKTISIVLTAVLISGLSLAQEEYDYPMTPEEEFYSGEQINPDTMGDPMGEDYYYDEMERQEEDESLYEVAPAGDYDWEAEEGMYEEEYIE